MITLFATYKKAIWCKPLIEVDSYHSAPTEALSFNSELNQNGNNSESKNPFTIYNQSNQTSKFVTYHEPNRQLLLLNELFSN